MIFRCRMIAPVFTTFGYIEAESPERAANLYHVHVSPERGRLFWDDRDPKNPVSIYFACFEVEGYGPFISRCKLIDGVLTLGGIQHYNIPIGERALGIFTSMGIERRRDISDLTGAGWDGDESLKVESKS